MVRVLASAAEATEFSRRARATTWDNSVMGSGLTRDGGGSTRAHERYKAAKRKSMAPCGFRRGSGDPIPAYVCPTPRRVSSTDRERAGRRLGVRVPARRR
jgi:hypothetical protein